MTVRTNPTRPASTDPTAPAGGVATVTRLFLRVAGKVPTRVDL